MRLSVISLNSTLRLLCCVGFFNAIVFGQISSSVTLSSSPNPANYGQAVSLQATVTAGATGKVTFYDGTTVLGIGTISGTQATLSTTLLASGTRSLRAYYQGNGSYGYSSSVAISQTVVAGVSLGFRRPVNYTAAASLGFMAVGDFNGNGRQDLAATNSTGVSVMLGNGDGTFQTAVNYATGTDPQSVAQGDFNGDGKTDLAVVNYLAVAILLGNGDGTFQTAVNYTLNNYSVSLIVGDFNGDGNMDLAGCGANTVGVLLGNGDGTFRTAVTYAVVTGGGSTVAAADLNGDGKADLVVGGYSGLFVLLGKGDGTFQPTVNAVAGASVSSVIAGDFNGDGKADVATLNYNGGAVNVLLGKGDGTLQLPVSYTVNPYTPFTQALVAADFNGDGRLDLATVNYYTNNLQLLFGNGDGTLQPAMNYPINQPLFGLAVGDFNGDGFTDLVAALQNGNYGVSVQLGGAIPDLAIAETHGDGFTQGQVGAVYTVTVTNVGDVATSGAVGVVQALASAFTATGISGDGWTCVLGTLACTRSDSAAPGAAYPPIRIIVNVSAGFTGNATSTASVSGGGDQNSSNNTVSDTAFIRAISTIGLSASPNPVVLGHAVTLTATVGSGATGKVTFYDGTTVLGAAAIAGSQASYVTNLLPSGTRSIYAKYLGDATHGPSRSTTLTLTVTVTATNGTQPSTAYSVGATTRGIATGDFNRDGKPDIVTSNSNGGMSVLLGNGDGYVPRSRGLPGGEQYQLQRPGGRGFQWRRQSGRCACHLRRHLHHSWQWRRDLPDGRILWFVELLFGEKRRSQ